MASWKFITLLLICVVLMEGSYGEEYRKVSKTNLDNLISRAGFLGPIIESLTLLDPVNSKRQATGCFKDSNIVPYPLNISVQSSFASNAPTGNNCAFYSFQINETETNALLIRFIVSATVDPLDWVIRVYSPTSFFEAQDTNYNYEFVYSSEESNPSKIVFWYVIQPCALTSSPIWYITVVTTSTSITTVSYTFNFTFIPPDPVYPISSGVNIAPTVPVCRRNPITYYQLQTNSNSQKLFFTSFLSVATYGGINVCTSRGTNVLDVRNTLLSTAPNQNIYLGFDASFVLATNVTYTFNSTLVNWNCKPTDYDIANVCPASNYPTNAWQNSYDSVYIIQYLLTIMQNNGFSTTCYNTLYPILCGLIFPKCDSDQFPIYPCQSDCLAIRSNCSGDFKKFGEYLPINKYGYFDITPPDSCPDVANCFVYYQNFVPDGTVAPGINSTFPPHSYSYRSTLSLFTGLTLLIMSLFFT